MEQSVATQQARAFVVLNPVAGQSSPEQVRSMLEAAFEAHGWQCNIYETQPDDNLNEQVSRVREEKYDLVIAAGGDGTVSMVANNLVGSGIPLGIMPVGTANVLALELGVPRDLQQAANLLLTNHRVRELDVMQMNDQHFLLQIGIGLDSLMVKDTKRTAKRLFGRFAYIGTLIGKLFGYQSRRFTILVDGKPIRPRAWQVLVANAGTLGVPPFRWGPDIHPTDGELDLCLFNVRTPADYVRLLWQLLTGRHKRGPNISYIRIHDYVIINPDRPLPVQADGEIVGETPVRISVVPRGIRIIVPNEETAASTIDVAREADYRNE